MKSMHSPLHAAILISVIAMILSAEVTHAKVDVAQTDPYAARKIFYETLWRNKISAALKYVDGAIVNVDVELTPETGRSVTEKNFGSRPIAEVESTESSRIKGRSIFAPKVQTAATPQSEASTKESTYTKFLVPETQEVTTTAGLIPRSVNVSVAVPKSYYAAVWKHRQRLASSDKENQREPTAADLNRIQTEVSHTIEQTVTALLPRSQSNRRIVRVTSFDNLANSKDRVARAKNQRSAKPGNVVTVVVPGKEAAVATTQ